VIGTKAYVDFQQKIAQYDNMVDQLSLAKATDKLKLFFGNPIWLLYLKGRKAQVDIETALAMTLKAEGSGRDQVLANWRQTETFE
jgi:hypothetical protein